jgi:hypothetical protein
MEVLVPFGTSFPKVENGIRSAFKAASFSDGRVRASGRFLEDLEGG